jgi:hypothetical protein
VRSATIVPRWTRLEEALGPMRSSFAINEVIFSLRPRSTTWFRSTTIVSRRPSTCVLMTFVRFGGRALLKPPAIATRLGSPCWSDPAGRHRGLLYLPQDVKASPTETSRISPSFRKNSPAACCSHAVVAGESSRLNLGLLPSPRAGYPGAGRRFAVANCLPPGISVATG